MSLHKKLLEARRAVHGVSKSGKNRQQGWDFVTVEDVTREALRALNEAGLVTHLRVASDQRVDVPVLDAYLHTVDPETGEELKDPMPWPIDRAGPQARRAAFSYARKQALVELLMLAEPDDPETHAGTKASAPEPHAATDESPRQSSQAASPVGKRGSGAVHTNGPKKPPSGDLPPSKQSLGKMHATRRDKGYGDEKDFIVWACGELGWSVPPPEVGMGDFQKRLNQAQVSKLIDALSAVKVAERRLEETPPDDPWQNAEQAVMADG